MLSEIYIACFCSRCNRGIIYPLSVFRMNDQDFYIAGSCDLCRVGIGQNADCITLTAYNGHAIDGEEALIPRKLFWSGKLQSCVFQETDVTVVFGGYEKMLAWSAEFDAFCYRRNNEFRLVYELIEAFQRLQLTKKISCSCGHTAFEIDVSEKWMVKVRCCHCGASFSADASLPGAVERVTGLQELFLSRLHLIK